MDKKKVIYVSVLGLLFWGHSSLFLWLTWWALFVTDKPSCGVFWWWTVAGVFILVSALVSILFSTENLKPRSMD